MKWDLSALAPSVENGATNEASSPMLDSGSMETPTNIEVNVNAPQPEAINPAPTPIDPEQQPQEETSVLDNILEIPEGIVKGVGNAINSTVDLGASAISFATDVATKGWDQSEFKDIESPIRIPEAWLPDVNTPTGKIVTDISQFATEFVGLGKLKIFKAGAEAGKLTKYTYETARGISADLLGFKAQSQNLTADLVELFPSLDGPLADFLKNDGSDDHITGRLKNALEGAGLGLAVDGMMKSFKVMRSALRHGNNVDNLARDIRQIEEEGLEQVTEAERREIGEAAGQETGEETAERTAIESTEQTAQETAQETTRETAGEAVEQVTPQPTPVVERSDLLTDPVAHTPLKGRRLEKRIEEYFADGMRKDAPLTETDILSIHKASVENPKFFEKLLSENVNFRNFAWDTEQGRSLVQGIHLEMASKLANSKKQSFSELMENVAKNAEEAGFDDVAEGLRKSKYDIAMEEVPEGKEMAQRLIYHDIQLRSLIPHMAENINILSQRILGGTATDKDVMMFFLESKRIQEVYRESRDIGTLLARGLNSRRIIPQMDGIFENLGKLEGKIPETLDDFTKMLENNGVTRKDIEKVARAAYTVTDPKRQMAIARTLAAPTWTKQFNFWFTQNILTGINTHLFNIGGNAVKGTLMASERVMGALWHDAIHGGNETRYAIDYATGLFANIASAFKLAGAAVKSDRSGLETATKSFGSKFSEGLGSDVMMLNSKESFDLMFSAKEASGKTVSNLERAIASGVSAFGVFGRGNARMMLGEDEFFRQLHFQASKRELINRKLDADGLVRGSKEWKKEFDKLDKDFFDENGLVNMKNPDAAEALNTASRGVFSEDITNETVNKIIRATNESAILKMSMPFIKTVWNVSVDSLEHIPVLQGLSRNYRDAIMGKLGERARQEAVGKFMASTMAASTVFYFAQQGYIVGALSSNPRERDAQLRSGMKPYSMLINDTWVSYQRADPIAACIGAVANYVTYFQSKDASDDELNEKASYIIGSFLSAIADKSFLTGLHDMLDVFFAGNTAGEKLTEHMGKQLGSMLPANGLVNQLWKNWLPNLTGDALGDSYYHEKDKSIFAGLKDSGYAGILNKMGWEAAQTPMKYDWITGEPVRRTAVASPDRYNEYVIGELTRESRAVYGPPMRSLHNVHLTPEEYSRYCELHGTVKIGGKTLMEALNDLMHSPAYDYKRERIADDTDAEGNTFRGDMINKVIRQYRKLAEQTLYHDFPELKADIEDKKAQRLQDRKPNPVTSERSEGQDLIETLNP